MLKADRWSYIREHTGCSAVLWAQDDGTFRLEIVDEKGRMLMFDSGLSADSAEKLQRLADSKRNELFRTSVIVPIGCASIDTLINWSLCLGLNGGEKSLRRGVSLTLFSSHRRFFGKGPGTPSLMVDDDREACVRPNE